MAIITQAMRRWMVAGVGAPVLAGVGIVSDIAGAQQYVCGLEYGRPICRVIGLGNTASREELALWQKITKEQSCEGYRRYIAKYPTGEFVAIATARHSAKNTVEKERWHLEDRSLPITVLEPVEGAKDTASARAIALNAGKEDAQSMLCKGYASGEHRLSGVDVTASRWNCHARHNGVACGFDGEVTCHIKVHVVDLSDDCSTPL